MSRSEANHSKYSLEELIERLVRSHEQSRGISAISSVDEGNKYYLRVAMPASMGAAFKGFIDKENGPFKSHNAAGIEAIALSMELWEYLFQTGHPSLAALKVRRGMEVSRERTRWKNDLKSAMWDCLTQFKQTDDEEEKNDLRQLVSEHLGSRYDDVKETARDVWKQMI